MVKNVDHQSWGNSQIAEAKILKLGLFPSNTVLFGCIWTITDFGVLCTL